MSEYDGFAMMSEREKYLFDLQGFLVIKGFLSADEVNALNEALDANADKCPEFGPPTREGTPLGGERAAFRQYRDMLEWEQPWCQSFRDLLAHPKLIPYLNTMFGRGWKLDHSVEVYSAIEGCEGLHLHGWGNAAFDGSRYYKYDNGRMRCALTVCQFYLADVNPGDGGLCVIPGSHKANFPLPKPIRMYEADREVVYNIPVKAGDLIIFNEATTHGTLPWKGKHERRLAFYRYVPKYFHWIGGVYETRKPEWVSELTDAQQAVLEPAYIYNRPLIENDGATITQPRWEADAPPEPPD